MLNKCGIYFLIGKDKEILYIGKSTNVFDRIKSHASGGIPFVDFRFMGCSEADLDKYEKRWILRFLPIDNHALKARKSAYKKKPKVTRPKWRTKDMHFRKLTLKSFVGFGKHKNEQVSRLIELNKPGDLASIYYKLSHITFMDDVLDKIGITEEWRIEKPGTDPEKFYAFCEAVMPYWVEYKKRMYEKIVHKRAKSAIRDESRLNHNKQKLQNKNMGRRYF